MVTPNTDQDVSGSRHIHSLKPGFSAWASSAGLSRAIMVSRVVRVAPEVVSMLRLLQRASEASAVDTLDPLMPPRLEKNSCLGCNLFFSPSRKPVEWC